jgi:hypothetical protein
VARRALAIIGGDETWCEPTEKIGIPLALRRQGPYLRFAEELIFFAGSHPFKERVPNSMRLLRVESLKL